MGEGRFKARGLRPGTLQHKEVREKENLGVGSEVLERVVFWELSEEKCFQEEEVVCIKWCWWVKVKSEICPWGLAF